MIQEFERIRFTISGTPRTKKNSQNILVNKRTGRPFVMPSAAFKEYEKECLWKIPREYRIGIDVPVNLKCTYYMPTERRVDLVNLLEGTCDILVDAGVISDDNNKIVAGHDGSRVFKDKDDPRVEIEITKI